MYILRVVRYGRRLGLGFKIQFVVQPSCRISFPCAAAAGGCSFLPSLVVIGTAGIQSVYECIPDIMCPRSSLVFVKFVGGIGWEVVVSYAASADR